MLCGAVSVTWLQVKFYIHLQCLQTIAGRKICQNNFQDAVFFVVIFWIQATGLIAYCLGPKEHGGEDWGVYGLCTICNVTSINRPGSTYFSFAVNA